MNCPGWIVALLVACALVACKKPGDTAGGAASSSASTPVKTGDESCEAKPLCKSRGLCGAKITTSGSVEARGSGGAADLAQSTIVSCVAMKPEHCRKSDDCKNDGMCTVEDGRCVAKSEADCRAAKICADEGRCKIDGAVREGECVATADDCKKATTCTQDGNCSKSKTTAFCEPESDEACAKAPGCKKSGTCKKVPGAFGSVRCRPFNDDHCKKSDACKDRGECKEKSGECVKA
jgi:hypothetical protein